MANQGGGNNSVVLREYRKGNWTVQETMVLIEAKKMDDERRMKRSQHGDHSSEGGRSSKPAELRWKWVEDYCWRNGCLRSQNQCNDKWDNLMRDFKKVRDHERRLAADEHYSYWKIEKNERKERNLPSNMLPQIYEALVEVVERKWVGSTGGGGGAAAAGGSNSINAANMCYVVESRPTTSSEQPSSLPPLILMQHTISAPLAAVLPLPPPPAPPPPPPPPHSLPYSHALPTVDSDTSEYSDSPAKRRRRGGEGTSGGTATASEVGSAISKSASIIAEAIQSCEEKEERRHRDLLSLHERRLKIEESKTEINRQGINGLVDAINKLANSVFALAAHKNQPTDPK